MFKKIQMICTGHFRNNLLYCIVILCSFLAGTAIAAACVLGLPELDKKELGLYLSEFFSGINKSGADSFEVFKTSVMLNVKIFAVTMLFSMMVIGAPFVAGVSAFLGFETGFTLMFMLKNYGISALLFALSGMLPHQLIFLPCVFVMLVESMRYSVGLNGRFEPKNKITAYMAKMSALFCVSILSALLQAYIEPIFIRLVSRFFL